MKWTREEVQYLQDNYRALSASEIGHVLGKTEGAIHQKAHLLGSKSGYPVLGNILSNETRRKMSESRKGRRFTREHREKLSMAAPKGSQHWNWKEDPSYEAQHERARADYPELPSTCEFCGEAATLRMRVDMTSLPYHRDLVVFGCKSCNALHSYNALSIVFTSPYDGLEYCAIKENDGAIFLEGVD